MNEKIKRLTPTKDTLVRLFAKSRNQCAFSNCDHEIFENDTFVGQVCHIEAALKGGERFNDEMTPEQRRDEDNLIILCYRHHKITDDESVYTVKKMQEMKLLHEELSQKVISLSDGEYKIILKDIQNDLSNKLNQINEKLDNLTNKLDFYGRNRLTRGNVPNEEDFDLFFGKFLTDDIDIAGLLLKAQPTLSDCKYVFNKDYYYDFFIYYILFYRQKLIEAKDETFNRFNEVSCFKNKKITQDDYGRHKERIKAIFKDHVVLYDIAFFQSEQSTTPIVSFHFWVFLNGRWVFFPKPLRAYREIDRLRDNEDLKTFATVIRRLIKCKLIPKNLGDLDEEKALLAMRVIIRQLDQNT